MIDRTALLQSVLFTDPRYVVDAIVDMLDNPKLADRWVLDLSEETQTAIESLCLCRSTVEQGEIYLNARVVQTLRTINTVTGLTVDRISL